MSGSIRRFCVRSGVIGVALGGFLLSGTREAQGDSFYSRSLLLGERASGMGGAFVAIADDPSGVFYNPGGIPLAIDDYLSVSVNAFQSASTTFQDVFPNGDYELNSLAFVPAFFGFTQKAGPGRFGFSLLVREVQAVDQNTRITGINDGENELYALNRQFARERVTYLAGPSYGISINSRLSVGLTAFGVYQSDRALDMQLGEFNPEGEGAYFIQNTYLNRRSFGVQPKLGVMLTPFERWSFGFTAAKTFHLQGWGEARQVAPGRNEDGTSVVQNGSFSNDYGVLQLDQLSSRVYSPWEFSGGIAWFPSEELLFSGQFDYVTADPDYPDFYPYRPSSFFNASVGAEWYLLPQLPIRLGVYTNNSSSPVLQDGLFGQPEHVNLLGYSAGFSFLGAGSSLSVSYSSASGSGAGQVIGGSVAVQDVQRSESTIYFAGSYAL
jgi:hypothetical protein